jgi:threonine dehydratase
MTPDSLSNLTQRILAFKIRGATNAIRSILSSNRDISPLDVTVVTHSSGNHAQALALASLQLGTRCHVVMPNNAPAVKKAAVLGYGAVVTECEPTLQAREDTASRVVQEEMDRQRNSGTKGIVEFVPPYDDARVICGQGTLALELLEQAKEIDRPLDIIITPVGGGGMLSGCAVASKGVDPSILVFGAEPAGKIYIPHHVTKLTTSFLGADDAHRSFESKTFVPSIKPNTIADGLLTSLGDITFPLILKYVDGIYTVSDSEIM